MNPSTEDQIRSLLDLIRFARQPRDPGDPPISLAQLDALFTCYKENTPAVVFNASVERMVRTLRALLEAGTTADKLRLACRMSFARDAGTHMATATAAYLAGFFTLNTVNLETTRQELSPAKKDFLGPAVMAVTSLLMQRLLRAGGMSPGWMRPVADDGKGEPKPAIQTESGFRRTLLQYWPFAISLPVINAKTRDPADTKDPAQILARTLDRLELRRSWGFLASAGVGLHRIAAFDREHVWLDASTDPKRAAMLGAIEQLTSPRHTVADLVTYLGPRPLAGALALLGINAIPLVNWAAEKMAGVSQESKNAHPFSPSDVWNPDMLKQPSRTGMRAFMIAAPVWAANIIKGAINAHWPDPSDARAAAADMALLLAWGPAIAQSERMVAEDAAIQADLVARAGVQEIALARRVPVRAATLSPAHAIAPPVPASQQGARPPDFGPDGARDARPSR